MNLRVLSRMAFAPAGMTAPRTLHNVTTLSGTASSVTVAKVGHGLMMMTWRTPHVSDEDAFEAMKLGMDMLPQGVKIFLNSGDFYGYNPPEANIELISRFFENYPDYADKAFLSVKSRGSSSVAQVEQRVDNILNKLRGKKSLDLFQFARLLPDVPVEQTMRDLASLIAKGKFDHIGLSECSAETVRRANTVFPVAAVEIEVSPTTYDSGTREVIATCENLDIAVVAYSPFGQGLLSGRWKTFDDINITADDPRRNFDRFQRDNFTRNLQLVIVLTEVAKKKSITVAQLSIAWVASRGLKVVPMPGSSNPNRHLENMLACDITFNAQELAEIDSAITANPIHGHRF